MFAKFMYIDFCMKIYGMINIEQNYLKYGLYKNINTANTSVKNINTANSSVKNINTASTSVKHITCVLTDHKFSLKIAQKIHKIDSFPKMNHI